MSVDDPPLYHAMRHQQQRGRPGGGGKHRWRDEPDTEEIAVSAELDVRVYEPTDPRLKRHVVHDPRSRAYALPVGAAPTVPIMWTRRGPILDQGQVGSCTANAALGLLMTEPFSTGRTWTEDDALALYHEETVLDEKEIPGVYPPQDTGSAGIYAMKALQNRGLITAYSHAFSLDAALAALAKGPIAVGTVWFDSMMTPDRDGYLTFSKRAKPAGGHEYVVDGWDPARGAVRMTNSWSASWGQGGTAWIKRADFAWLLAQDGDVVQPTVAVPAPGPVNPQPQPADAFVRDVVAELTALLQKLKKYFNV